MNLEGIHKVENVYMVGIGGIGMSALARYFLLQGKRVAGYDRVSTRLTDDLVREGSEIHFTPDLSFIREQFPDPENLLVVYTPAVPQDHLELAFLRQEGYRILKRAEVLGILSDAENCIAVAGTHGKTTISTLIAHLLQVAGIPCNAFLGGISKNYRTNAILSGQGRWMVLEADEFDRSFLHLNPAMAVVSSVDPDHLDVYGTYDELKKAFCTFIGQIDREGHLICREGLDLPCLGAPFPLKHTYGLGGPALYAARNIRSAGEGQCFDAETPDGPIENLSLGIPGTINVENALAAVCLGRLLEIGEDHIRGALASFQGVIRRFDVRIRRDDLVYIDDYAHHPRELEACIRSVREHYPGRKITGVFQPHLYSRTSDFADGFARSLSELDELILLDIYPAREAPAEGVSSRMIFDRVTLDRKILIAREQLMPVLSERSPEVLLTLGAGDIDQFVEPIVNLYAKEKTR